jgi:hypothetical protein
MGYRSTVAFVISFKTKEQLDNYLAPRLLEEYIRDERDRFERISWDDASVLYHVEDVKWYDYLPDVQAFTRLYQDAVDAGGAYRFIRIGEDDKDIEETSGESDKVEAFQDDFYPVTTIIMPSAYKLTFGEEQ